MSENLKEQNLPLPEEVNLYDLPTIILDHILDEFVDRKHQVIDGWCIEHFVSGNVLVPGSVILIDKPTDFYIGYEILITREDSGTERRSVVKIGNEERVRLFDLLTNQDGITIQPVDQNPSVEQP